MYFFFSIGKPGTETSIEKRQILKPVPILNQKKKNVIGSNALHSRSYKNGSFVTKSKQKTTVFQKTIKKNLIIN